MRLIQKVAHEPKHSTLGSMVFALGFRVLKYGTVVF